MQALIDLGPDCRERFLDQDQFPELREFDIWIGGLSELRGRHNIARRFAGRAMLSFALEGGSYFRIGEEAGHLRGGDAIFVPPEVDFTLRLDEQCFRRAAWLIVEWTPAWQALAALPSHFRWSDGEHFAAALQALDAEHFGPPDPHMRRHLLELCRAYMLRQVRRQTGEAHDELVLALLRTMLGDLAQPWSIEELGKRAGLSSAQLHRRFVAECGESPMARLKSLRLQRAALLLRDSERPIGMIAESIGYLNAFYFSAAFKACFGESPSGYRKRHRASGR